MCDSCDLARELLKHNPGIRLEIECTEGQNADDPLRGIDWTWWPGNPGHNEKLKQKYEA